MIANETISRVEAVNTEQMPMKKLKIKALGVTIEAWGIPEWIVGMLGALFVILGAGKLLGWM